MPAAEAVVATTDERSSYELAFHVLPTVAEGEVPNVFESLKAHIIKTGGDIFDSEAPERFDLAYEIVKHMEGKNRRFTSAYFGWIRFKVAADTIEAITEAVEENTDILRYLLIKLTKSEEANVFRFHEALENQKMDADGEEAPAVESKEKKETVEKEVEKTDDTEDEETPEKSDV